MNKLFLRFWPVGIILVLWLMFSAPYVIRGHIPFPSTYLVTFFTPWAATHGMPVKNNAMPDVITQIYPWKRVTIDAWKNGEIPLWNPYSFSGTSHVGTYQSAVFSPVNALFLWLPEKDAWSIMILLQPLLAGIFMYGYLRLLSVSRTSAVVGSTAFMFCGFMTVWLAYGTLSYAVLYLPLILYGIHRYMTEEVRMGGIVAAAGLMLSFVSGHFQMSAYVLLFSVSYALYLGLRAGNSRRLLWMLLPLLCGVGLAAPQLFPGFMAYKEAVRSSLFLKGEVIPWQYIVTLFSPDFYGNPVTRNDWFGHYAEWAGYVGVAPLLLAAFALIGKGKKYPAVFFAAAAGVILLFAFQTPLVDLLFALKIPVLSTSSASRIIVLLSFSLAVLSAIGLDELVVRWDKREFTSVRRWLIGTGIILVVIWSVVVLVKPLPTDKLTVAVRNTILPTLFAVASLAVAGLGMYLPKKIRSVLPFVLVLITGIDMYRFSSKWMPFDPAEFVYPTIPVIGKLQSLVAVTRGRVFGNIGNELGSAFGIPLIEGYDAVYQYRYGRFMSAASNGTIRGVDRSVVVFDKHGQYTEDILQLLGVRYYAHKKSDGRFPWAYPFWEYPQYQRIWEDEHFEILENAESFPRAFLASSYVVKTEEQEILNTLFEDTLDRRETLVLEKKPKLEPQSGMGTATISSYRPAEVVIDVATEKPKLLFLSDVYDEGWRASVDGRETEIYRADFDFRAVAVPEGSHTVRMWYAPLSVYWGYAGTGFATLGLVLFMVWKRKK